MKVTLCVRRAVAVVFAHGRPPTRRERPNGCLQRAMDFHDLRLPALGTGLVARRLNELDPRARPPAPPVSLKRRGAGGGTR